VQLCIRVSGLKQATALDFVLPKGSKYSLVSPESMLMKDFVLPITSTLRFTIPFTRKAHRLRTRIQKELNTEGVRSTLLTLWLPHGLSNKTTAEDVADALEVDEIPAPWGGPDRAKSLSLSVNITKRYLTLAYFKFRW
jgi:hypothetical protein